MKPWYVHVSLHCDSTEMNHQQSELKKKQDEEAERRAAAEKEAAAQKAEEEARKEQTRRTGKARAARKDPYSDCSSDEYY